MSSPALVIHCADELRRRGLTSLFDESSVRLTLIYSARDDSPIPRPAGALLVFPDSGRHADRFRCLQRLPVQWAIETGPAGVAVCRKPLDLLLVLRLVESGISYLVDDDEVASDPRCLLTLHQSIDERYRLPTSWELRARLGLRWDGDMARFCALLEQVPAGTWIEEWKQHRLPVSRRRIQALRQAAFEIAGMPPPDPTRFSTAWRDSPSWPVWAEVRDAVQRLWGIRTDDRQLFV